MLGNRKGQSESITVFSDNNAAVTGHTNLPNQRSQSRINLHSLPVNSLLQVFRCMNTSTLCRLRQTCKMIEGCVEMMRFKINTRREDSTWTFTIRMKPKTEKVKFAIVDGVGYDYGRPEIERLDMTAKPRDYQMSRKIQNPYKQLSAISIGAVAVVQNSYCHWDETNSNEEYEDDDEDEEQEEEGEENEEPVEAEEPKVKQAVHSVDLTPQVVEILLKLRLDVNWLLLHCKVTPELASSLRFAKIRNEWRENSFSLLQSMKKKSNEIVTIYGGETTFADCRKCFSSIETMGIRFQGRDIDDWKTFLNEVLTSSKSARGVLKRLTAVFGYRQVLSLLPSDLTLMYKFSFPGRRYKFFKTPVDGGFTIIIEEENRYFVEISFVKGDDRKEILDVVKKYFYSGPIKEGVVLHFLHAFDDRDAIHGFRKATTKLIHYLSGHILPYMKQMPVD